MIIHKTAQNKYANPTSIFLALFSQLFSHIYATTYRESAGKSGEVPPQTTERGLTYQAP
jgi:hypothetical protein